MDGGQEGPFMIRVFYLLVSASRSYKRAIRNFIFEQQKGSVSVPGMHSHCQSASTEKKSKAGMGRDAQHGGTATHTDDRKKKEDDKRRVVSLNTLNRKHEKGDTVSHDEKEGKRGCDTTHNTKGP